MAEIIEFDRFGAEPDPDTLDRPALLAYLDTVRARLAALDAGEPPDMDSEEHAAWGDRHEALEDLADDIRDRLDALGGGD